SVGSELSCRPLNRSSKESSRAPAPSQIIATNRPLNNGELGLTCVTDFIGRITVNASQFGFDERMRPRGRSAPCLYTLCPVPQFRTTDVRKVRFRAVPSI